MVPYRREWVGGGMTKIGSWLTSGYLNMRNALQKMASTRRSFAI